MSRIPQNTEYRRIPYIRQNTPEHGRIPIYRGALIAAVLVLTVTFCRLGAPAIAQQGPTVTPYPAAVATATASAQQMSAALNAKAQAAQQAEQARANAAAADAQFNAAQQAANEARALLASQQIAAASEALGRAEGAIASGKSIISDTLRWLDSMAATNSQQADQISIKDKRIAALEIENGQLKVDKQTILANYNALNDKVAESEARLSVNPVVAILAVVVVVAVILLVIAWRWSRRDPPRADTAPADAPTQAPLEGEYTVSAEDEQNF